MLHNYLTILRQPLHTLLNLSCLCLGIAAALLVLLYLDFELNYDRSHANADRIYRIDTRVIQTHEKEIAVDWTTTPANLGPYLQQDYPEVEKWVHFFKFWQNDMVSFEYQDKNYEETDVYAVDSSVFQIFSCDLIEGKYLAVNYNGMVPVLLEALKTVIQENATMKAELAEIKQTLQDL